MSGSSAELGIETLYEVVPLNRPPCLACRRDMMPSVDLGFGKAGEQPVSNRRRPVWERIGAGKSWARGRQMGLNTWAFQIGVNPL